MSDIDPALPLLVPPRYRIARHIGAATPRTDIFNAHRHSPPVGEGLADASGLRGAMPTFLGVGRSTL